jgi:DNA-binding response OmpR family regulator
MPRILILAEQTEPFEDMIPSLDSVPAVETIWAHTGEAALEMAAADSPDLVIVDEYIGGISGLEWIRRLMGVNAFIQTAAVSSQPQDAFHDASEGLGVMAHLPTRPGRFEAELLLKTLNQLTGQS